MTNCPQCGFDLDSPVNKDLAKAPRYVRMHFGAGYSVVLRLITTSTGKLEYWKDDGAWAVGFREEKGKLYSMCRDPDHLNNLRLKPSTKEEWAEDNNDDTE